MRGGMSSKVQNRLLSREYSNFTKFLELNENKKSFTINKYQG